MDEPRELERRLIPDSPALSVKEDQNGRTVIRGYAALYDTDSQPLGPANDKFIERIKPGAFDGVVRSNPDVFARYNHERLLGRTVSGTLRLSLDDRGLAYEIDPKPADADVVQSLERGDLRGSSFAFFSAKSSSRWYRDELGRKVREIRSIDWLGDVGPVDTPAYKETEAYVSQRSLEEAAELDVPPSDDDMAAQAKTEQTIAEEPEAREADSNTSTTEEVPVNQQEPEEQAEHVSDETRSDEPDFFGIAMKLKAEILTSRLHAK
jgi:uncharacterized protein